MIPHFVAAVMTTAKALERQCPHCLRKQLTPPSRLRETVACKHCGELIPPPPNDKEAK